MKTSILFGLICLGFLQVKAQVAKKTVVEHFTNSRCSICAARNPGFFTNLKNQTNVIHLAIYPSAPYAACLLNQHNKIEADDRTNYYNVYGSTPRLVINGASISTSADYSSSSLFTPYLGQTSPVSIKIRQAKYSGDSISSTIVIKTESNHSLSNQKLFVALAEDTVFYAGPNGETQHYNVFRKTLTGSAGIAVNLPASVGDSLVYEMRSPANSAWNFSRIFTLAILQDDNTKLLTQSESVSAKANTVMNIQNLPGSSQLAVFAPRDGSRNIYIQGADVNANLSLELSDINGKTILTKNIQLETEMINGAALSRGTYIYIVRKENKIVKSGKLVLE